MAFENNGSQWYGTSKLEFVYFFKSSIILDPILAWRKDSSISGFSIGPTLLVSCCVKAISIHVINVK